MHTGLSPVFEALSAPVLTWLYNTNMLYCDRGTAIEAGKQNRKKQSDVKIANMSGKFGLLSRSRSPCSTHDHYNQLANTRTKTTCFLLLSVEASALAFTRPDMQATISLRVRLLQIFNIPSHAVRIPNLRGHTKHGSP